MSDTWLELIYPVSATPNPAGCVNSQDFPYGNLAPPNISPTEQSRSSLTLHVRLDDVNHVERAEGVAVPEIVFPSLL